MDSLCISQERHAVEGIHIYEELAEWKEAKDLYRDEHRGKRVLPVRYAHHKLLAASSLFTYLFRFQESTPNSMEHA